MAPFGKWSRRPSQGRSSLGERAGRVMAWLKQAGIDGRYTTAGVGKATQTGPEARRVEVTISWIPTN